MKLQMNIISMKKKVNTKKKTNKKDKKSFTISYINSQVVGLYKKLVISMQDKGYDTNQSKLFEFLTVFFDWILNQKENILNEFLNMLNESQKYQERKKEDEENIYD